MWKYKKDSRNYASWTRVAADFVSIICPLYQIMNQQSGLISLIFFQYRIRNHESISHPQAVSIITLSGKVWHKGMPYLMFFHLRHAGNPLTQFGYNELKCYHNHGTTTERCKSRQFVDLQKSFWKKQKSLLQYFGSQMCSNDFLAVLRTLVH